LGRGWWGNTRSTTRLRSGTRIQGMKEELSLDSLKIRLRQFASDRDWDQFHSPKNLAMALSVECAELVERFQWVTEEASMVPSNDEMRRIREELADILNYLVRISDKLGIDLLAAAAEKIQINETKYPVEKSRGSAKKYTEL
jgi:dCTP diphosphatase